MFPKTDTLFRLCSPSYSHSFKHLCTSLEVLANLHRILEHREDLYSTLYYCTAGCTTPQDILPTQNLCFRCATSPIPSYITRAKVHSKTSYYMTLHTGVHTSRAVVTLDSTIDTHKDSLQYFEHSLAIRDVQEQWSRISYQYCSMFTTLRTSHVLEKLHITIYNYQYDLTTLHEFPWTFYYFIKGLQPWRRKDSNSEKGQSRSEIEPQLPKMGSRWLSRVDSHFSHKAPRHPEDSELSFRLRVSDSPTLSRAQCEGSLSGFNATIMTSH